MRVAKGQIHLLRFRFRAVTDSVYFEHPGEAFAHALDHVGNQLAHQAVDRALFPAVAGTLDDYLPVRDLNAEARMEFQFELALRPLGLNRIAGDRPLDGLVEMNRESSYP